MRMEIKENSDGQHTISRDEAFEPEKESRKNQQVQHELKNHNNPHSAQPTSPPPPSHKETPLIPRHRRRAQRIPPPPRKTPILISHQKPAIQPLPPVPVQILLAQAHKPVVRPHTADEVELAPGGVAFACDEHFAHAALIGGLCDRLEFVLRGSGWRRRVGCRRIRRVGRGHRR